MISVLADSSDDAAIIAKAVGGTARIVDSADQFSNGSTLVDCLVLGCRNPIPEGRIQLLREIERRTPWLPVILVTDPEPDAIRRLGEVKVVAVVWFEELRNELRWRIEGARQSVPLLSLADQVEGSPLSPALRHALAYSLRAATDRPVRNVKALADAVHYSPITLSKAFSTWRGGRTTLSRFLNALVILRAKQLHSVGHGWKSVSARLGFTRETLQRKSKRFTGHTLGQLARLSPDQLLLDLVSDFLRQAPATGTEADMSCLTTKKRRLVAPHSIAPLLPGPPGPHAWTSPPAPKGSNLRSAGTMPISSRIHR